MQKSGWRITFISLFFLAALSNNGVAQKTLSLNEAIQTALKNSYEIQLVENNLAIAKNNNRQFVFHTQGECRHVHHL